MVGRDQIEVVDSLAVHQLENLLSHPLHSRQATHMKTGNLVVLAEGAEQCAAAEEDGA